MPVGCLLSGSTKIPTRLQAIVSRLVHSPTLFKRTLACVGLELLQPIPPPPLPSPPPALRAGVEASRPPYHAGVGPVGQTGGARRASFLGSHWPALLSAARTALPSTVSCAYLRTRIYLRLRISPVLQLIKRRRCDRISVRRWRECCRYSNPNPDLGLGPWSRVGLGLRYANPNDVVTLGLR